MGHERKLVGGVELACPERRDRDQAARRRLLIQHPGPCSGALCRRQDCAADTCWMRFSRSGMSFRRSSSRGKRGLGPVTLSRPRRQSLGEASPPRATASSDRAVPGLDVDRIYTFNDMAAEHPIPKRRHGAALVELYSISEASSPPYTTSALDPRECRRHWRSTPTRTPRTRLPVGRRAT